MTGADKDPREDTAPENTAREDTARKDKPANTAPDAVMDPNEKTEGKPGQGPQGGGQPDGETDPGSG